LYEARGLLPPAERTSSGYRCYTEHDIQLLRFIRQARDIGLSLAEIRTIIGLRRGETPPGREVITLLQAHLDAIDHKISNLRALRQAMTGVLHAAAAHADQGQPVRLCQIMDTSKAAPAAARAHRTSGRANEPSAALRVEPTVGKPLVSAWLEAWKAGTGRG
jgi:MerR family copper efflux transcriptional regulator